MKLDLLVGDSLEDPIVRFSGFSVEEAKSIGESLRQLARDEIAGIEIHDLPCVEVVGNFRLLFRIAYADRGIRFLDSHTIEFALTAEAWGDVAGLVEPFESGSHGYQWLFHAPGCPSILMSADGDW